MSEYYDEERERDRSLMAKRRQAEVNALVDMRGKVIGHWPCRNTDCRKPVVVTDAAFERFEQFNKYLRARRDPPLSTAEIVFCGECELVVARMRAKKYADRDARTKAAIVELKGGAIGARADFLYAQLIKDHHPDVPGLKTAIEERRQGGKGKNVGKREF